MKPILFNIQMVKAILDGKKTVTRRCVKFPNYVKQQENGLYTLYADGTCYEDQYLEGIQKYFKSPYKVGDILYVRETWQCWRAHRYEATADIRFKAGGDGVQLEFPNGNTDSIDRFEYDYFVKKWFSHNGGWNPSLFMPQKAARIFLKVTAVKMERLQDITDVGAKKEGAAPDNPLNFPPNKWPNLENFKIIWDSTIKKSDIGTYGWNANPWVWVIEFERCSKPIE